MIYGDVKYPVTLDFDKKKFIFKIMLKNLQ